MRRLLIIIMFFTGLTAYGQTPTDTLPGDPGGLYIFIGQNLNFGAFSHGSTGGTISVNPQGVRSTTGDIQLLNLGFQYYNAIFEIEAPPGAIITLSNGPDVTLTGSNGGTVSLHIGSHNPATPLVSNVLPPSRTKISVGGTLTVGNHTSSPPGTYSGNFFITFNQQ